MEFTHSAGQAGHQAPGILLPSAEITGCTWPFMWVLAIQTEVFVIVQQTL